MKRNNVTPEQAHRLPEQITKLHKESNLHYNLDGYVLQTLKAINDGIEGKAPHDAWIDDWGYCLCQFSNDADGELVYIAYQLWTEPEARSRGHYKALVKFLRFYAQKHQAKRLIILSSRLDKIKGYQRGLGKGFLPRLVTFSENY